MAWCIGWMGGRVKRWIGRDVVGRWSRMKGNGKVVEQGVRAWKEEEREDSQRSESCSSWPSSSRWCI